MLALEEDFVVVVNKGGHAQGVVDVDTIGAKAFGFRALVAVIDMVETLDRDVIETLGLEVGSQGKFGLCEGTDSLIGREGVFAAGRMTTEADMMHVGFDETQGVDDVANNNCTAKFGVIDNE